MKNLIISSLVAFCLVAVVRGADPDFVGKTVIIRTAKESSSCIRVENYLPAIGTFDRKAPEACAFRVVAGSAPGTVMFEWLKEPGLFLQHRNYRIQVLKDDKDSATFRIVRPLRGNEGISLLSFNMPTFYVTIVEKGQLFAVENGREPRKSVFFIQELPK
jgi:hypothetical protein